MFELFRFIALVALSLQPQSDGSWRYPTNELGEACPYPLDPLQRVGQPLGQYHCPYCGGMQIAGIPHIDWASLDETQGAID